MDAQQEFQDNQQNDNMLHDLQQLRAQRHPQQQIAQIPRIKPSPISSIRRGSLYRTYSFRQQRAIVLFHFGSLQPNQEQIDSPMNSVRQVSLKFKVNYCTTKCIIDRYVRNNFELIDLKKNRGRKPQPVYLAVLHYITNQSELENQAYLSLQGRCAYITQRCGYRFRNRFELKNLYKRFNIISKAPQTTYKIDKDNDLNHQRLRIDFARQLTGILLDPEQTIIYFDETSFRTWFHKKKTWMHKDQHGRIIIPTKNIGGTTLYGAIGNALQQPVFYTADSTNSADFRVIIHMIVEELRPDLIHKPYLLMDNHAAHRNSEFRVYLDQHFQVLFTPSYSCRFNSIESAWAYIKRQYMQQFSDNFDEFERASRLKPHRAEFWHRQFVSDLCGNMDDAAINAFISANQKYLITLLQQAEIHQNIDLQ